MTKSADATGLGKDKTIWAEKAGKEREKALNYERKGV